MATISKHILSESNHGDGIKIVQTATAGTTIHTANDQTDDIDEVWLWACNTNATAVILTLEWSSAVVDDNIKVSINPNETVLVAPGWPLRNTLVIKGFATVANKVNVFGFVNRIVV
jgi:hypothetical protein